MQTNQHGLTLVEVMVATAIAVTVAYSSLAVFPMVRKMTVKTRAAGSCRAYLAQNFNRLQQLGGRQKITVSAPPSFLSKTLPPLPAVTGASSNALGPQAGWKLITFVDSSQPTQIRTAGLYMGDAVLMAALYRTPSICSSDVTFPHGGPSNLMIDPPTEMKTGFSIKMRIEPINLTTGQRPGCTATDFNPSTDFIVAPKGLDPTTSEAEHQSPVIARLADKVRNNMAFAVTLTAKYDMNGMPMSCDETRNIMFTADLTRPDPPTISYYQNPAYGDYYRTPSMAQITFSYHYPAVGPEPSVVLMCRDRSTITPLTSPPSSHPSKAVSSYWTVLPRREGKWVPCEAVTACGISKTNSTPLGSSGSSFAIRNNHSGTHGLPYGCRVIIDAVAVDPSGNVSSTTTINQPVNDPI